MNIIDPRSALRTGILAEL